MKRFCTIFTISLILAACGQTPENRLAGRWEIDKDDWEYPSLNPPIHCFHPDGRQRRTMPGVGWLPESRYSILESAGDRVLVDVVVDEEENGEIEMVFQSPDFVVQSLPGVPDSEPDRYYRTGSFEDCEVGNP